IAVPAFTLNIRENDIFNPATTPPDRVGALSDYIWQRDEAIRSTCPVHSYVAIGRDAAILRDSDPCQSLGPGSAFDIMRRERYSLLLLGCTFTEGATFVHHVEAESGVPYREWIELPRQIQLGAAPVKSIAVRYYARARHLDGTNDLSSVESAAVNRNAGTVVPIPGSPRQSHLLDLTELTGIVRDVISREPFALFRQNQEA
ncbi:MAG: AAC(3) family N-acetyltransferase, partial [Proteobacteria bacterium]|nr:AAC(3) family N-acetyltransferase [Pseudomonadota bacterium]